eukprot:3817069-Lingulodinium_polyedra.AAC.1
MVRLGFAKQHHLRLELVEDAPATPRRLPALYLQYASIGATTTRVSATRLVTTPARACETSVAR